MNFSFSSIAAVIVTLATAATAQADFQCRELVSGRVVGKALVVKHVDPGVAQVTLSHYTLETQLNGTYTVKVLPGLEKVLTYELKDPNGAPAKLTLKKANEPTSTRGGWAFCGRGGCEPQPIQFITGLLEMANEEVDFICYEINN